MLKNSTQKISYYDIDYEIRDLTKCLNEIDGIETIESCCGHGKDKCYIWFVVENCEILNKFLFHCFNHEKFWTVCVDTGDPNRTWKDLHLILISNEICKQSDFDKLTFRIRERISDIKMSDEEWSLLK